MERTNKRQIVAWMMVAVLVLALAVIAAVGLNAPVPGANAEDTQGQSQTGGVIRQGGVYLIGDSIIFEGEAWIRYDNAATVTSRIDPGEYTVVTPEYDPNLSAFVFSEQFTDYDTPINFSIISIKGTSYPVAGFTCIRGDGTDAPYEFSLVYYDIRVGETGYFDLGDAFEASDDGDVLVLLNNIDISDKSESILVDKSVTIDLNGYMLNVGSSAGEPAITVGDNDNTNGSVVLSVINSVPADGGILGFCYVGQDGSYILFSDCRLSFTVEQMEATSDINKIATGYEVVEIESTDSAYFDGFLTIIKPHTHTHDDVTFTAWESTTSLPGEEGNYYLTADVTIASTWSAPSGTTNLCLNGHGITMTGNDCVVYVGSGYTLNLYDEEGADVLHYFNVDSDSCATGINDISGSNSFTGGYITGGKGKASTGNRNGGGLFIDGGTFNLYGGNIIGNKVTVSDNCGAGVFLNDNATFRMYGGSLSYNYAQNAGCAIFGWHNSTIEIYGGEMSHNKTTWSSGSAISFYNQSGYTVSLKWYGGVIHDNLTGAGGGAVNLSESSLTVGLKGAPIVRNNTTASTNSNAALNVYVGNKPINIEGALTNPEKIGIRLASGTGVFTSGWSTYMGNADPADYFYSENEAYGVYLKGGEAAILEEAPPAPISLGEGLLYVGGEDIVKADNYTVNGTGGGKAVLSETDGKLFLTLTDYVYEGPGYNGGGEGGGIDYRGGGDLTILLEGNSTITKANDDGISRSHGIYFAGGTLTVDGTGSLTIRFDENRGGWKSNGIFCEPGAFVMNGGTVESNAGTGDESAGIYTDNGITFNGGSFAGNGYYTTDYESRGIYSPGTITVNGGTVYASAPLDNQDEARAFDTSTVIINSGTVTAYGKVAFSNTWGVEFGAQTTRTILAGDDPDSATEVESVGQNGDPKYVYITARAHVHNYSEDWSSDDTYHWHDCLNADCNVPEGSKAAHAYGDDINEATYYACSVCGYENQDRKDEYEAYQAGGPVTKYELYIEGTQVTSEALSGEGWSYDPETNTLTLNNFTYEGEGSDNSKLWHFNSVVTYAGEEPFSLILAGENSITNTKDNYDYTMAFLSTADLTISGNGSLTLSAPNTATTMSMGLCVDANLTINGGEITAFGGASEWRSAGICVFGKRFIQNGGSVFAQGSAAEEESYGVYALGIEQVSNAGDDDFAGDAVVDGITIGAGIRRFVAGGYTSALYTKATIDFKRDCTAWTDMEHAANGASVSAGEYENAALTTYKYIAIEAAKDSRWVIKMKAKSSVSSAYDAFIAEDETVVRVYDVCLYRIAVEGGEEREPVPAQPSDIAAGMTLTVKLSIPDALLGKNFTILHVHAADDYAFVDFERDADGKYILIRGVDRLSDFAFVAKKADLNPSTPADPSVPSDPSVPDGGQTLDIEPAVTQEDDPAIDNWTLTPQGEQGEGGDNRDKKPAVTVSLEDTEAQENVSVEVEVKTEISEDVRVSDRSVLHQALQSGDEIAIVYDVKLIRTRMENGLEIREEIQPSDIKPGTIVSIEMTIPEELRGKRFKLLHIHAEDDIKEVNSYSISEDGKTLTVRVNRLSEFAFVGKASAGGSGENGKEPVEPNKIPDGAIAGIVIGSSFGVLLLGLLIFFLLKRDKKNDDGDKNKNASRGVSDKQKDAAGILAAPVAGKRENVGFYRITVDETGKCTFALLSDAENNLSKEMGVFKSEKAARDAIRVLRAKGAGLKVENRVRQSGESIPAPKFVFDVDRKGVYRYSVLDEDGAVLLQSVQYLNEKRCLQDLKLALVCITTDVIVGQSGEATSDEIIAVEAAPVTENAKTPEEAVAETVEEVPVEETSMENAAEEPVEEAPAEEAEEAEEIVEAPAEAVSLKESLLSAKATLSHGKINKKHIAEYLKNKYGDCVRLNCRVNETKTGLPLADTHYTINDKQNVCFIYVYEVGETAMLLVKVDEAYGKSLAEKHPTVKRSAFPKAKYAWYSVIVDDSFREQEVEEIIDAAYLYCGGKAREALSLKESLAAAQAIETDAERTKKGIADFLTEKFGAGVRINSRANRTRTKRPLADTHYAIKDEKRACFVYVYEVGTVVLLVRLPEAFAEKLMQKHATVKRSAFPKAKYAWYSVILDDSFTDAEVHEVLVTAHDAVLD